MGGAGLRLRSGSYGLWFVGLLVSGVSGGPSVSSKLVPTANSISASLGDLAAVVPAAFRESARGGTEDLVEGRFSDAVESLSVLASDLPENSKVQTALAIAHLERSSTPRASVRDLVLALEAAERAASLAPRSSLALYLKAEVLTRLHLPAAATAAWTQFLAADPDSPQTAHAEAMLRELEEPSAHRRWEGGDRIRFEMAARAGDERALYDLVRHYPLFARLHAEETLLPQVARSNSRSEWAALRRIGNAFAIILFDHLLADTIAVIDHSPPERTARILRGLDRFGQGMDYYRQRTLGDASPHLLAAVQELSSSDCPFAGWAEYYSAVLLHRSSAGAAEKAFARLASAIDAIRYPALAGRVRWLQATGELVKERPEAALHHYRAAFDLLVRAEGEQLEGYLHLLIGETYGKLGDRDREWREYLQALPPMNSSELRAQHATLYQIVESLLAEGRPWAALGFSRELSGIARLRQVPSAGADAGLQRGRILEALGRSQEAIESFKTARAFAARVAMPDLRERVESILEMAEGRAVAAEDPAQGIERLGSALARQRRLEYRYQEASLLTSRAAVLRALGRFAEAADDLIQALSIYEGKRGATRDESLRKFSFEEAQAAFDAMVSLQANELDDPGTAFEVAERSRARLLLDQRSRHIVQAWTSIPRRIASEWPGDVALVEYAVLADRLYIWTIFDGKLRLQIERGSARSLERQVEILVGDLSHDRWDEAADATAADLFDRLIRPFFADLPPGTPLAIVPDRFLARLPFTMLLDRRSGRRLIEDRAITMQPSAALYLFGRRQGRPAPSGRGSWLIVGDPQLDLRSPSLKQLPQARKEARAVAVLHPGSTLLIGAAATREAFVRKAPSARAIHIAAHAILDPHDPSRTRLILADGTFFAHEIAKLDLSRTDLVILSVCQGTAGADRGRENVAGLAAAFLAAGARTVVASPSSIDDRATREAMGKLHLRLASARSIGEAVRGLLTQGNPPEAWAERSRRPVFIVFGQ